MEMAFGEVNWLAILLCLVVGQVFLTLWFVVVFADPWAKAYGAADKAQHTSEIPPYTYAIGAVCVVLLSLGLSVLHQMLTIETVGAALYLGLFVAIFFSAATALPGYAFLKKIDAFLIAIGSQVSLILIVSVILVLWR